MISNLIKYTKAFTQIYERQGVEALINCSKIEQFQDLVNHIKLIKAEHVGIYEKDRSIFFKKGKISYFNITEDSDVSIGVFCLSAGTYMNLTILLISTILIGALAFMIIQIC